MNLRSTNCNAQLNQLIQSEASLRHHWFLPSDTHPITAIVENLARETEIPRENLPLLCSIYLLRKYVDHVVRIKAAISSSEMKLACLWKSGNSTPKPFPLPHRKGLRIALRPSTDLGERFLNTNKNQS